MATHSSVLAWRVPGMDGGAWWAAVSGVAQSQTQLKRLSSSTLGEWNFKKPELNPLNNGSLFLIISVGNLYFLNKQKEYRLLWSWFCLLFCRCSCRNRSVLLTFGSWTSSQVRGPMNLGNYIWIFMVVCLSGEERIHSWHPFVVVQSLSWIRLFVTPLTAVHQASCLSLYPGVCPDSCPLSW